METLRIVTAGSVDDGKSTLIGRLLYETQSLKIDQLEQIKKKSRALGYDYLDFSLATDGLLTEREQGITIDVSHIYFKTPKKRFIIADSPGHFEYTRNMVTGASNAQVALILLDARKGVKEQTKRHLYINEMMGIEHLIFIVNKMDLIGYDKKIFDALKKEIQKLIKEGAIPGHFHFVPVSALKGDNICCVSRNTPWYTGLDILSLIEAIKIHLPVKQESILQIQHVIRPKKKGYHDYRGFSGKVRSGQFKRGDSVEVFPSGTESKIKRIEKYGENKAEVRSGENATLLLEDEIDASRGNTFFKKHPSIQTTNTLKASICWMQQQPLVAGKKYWLQQGVQLCLSRVTTIENKMNWECWKTTETKSLEMNDIGTIEIQLAQSLMTTPYKKNKNLGTFILIDEQTNNTAGVGFIT